MDSITYGLVIFITICMILIWGVSIYNKFQEFIVRINEAENNIDSILRKRFDLLNKAIGVIKDVKSDEEDILEVVGKLRSQKLTNFDLDRKLYEAINEFNLYKDKIESLNENESFVRIDVGINDSEIEITAFRKYYNDIITEYNKAVKRFPSIIVALLCHYKTRLYFDGKDTTDNITNDFKL